MTNYEYRAAVAGDAAALTVLARDTYRDAFGASMTSADLEAHLDVNLSQARVTELLSADRWLVALNNQDICGFTQYGSLRSDYPYGSSDDIEIRRLYVAAAHQNKGIGQTLLRTVLAETAASTLYLDVWVKNLGAQRLYRRHGFHVVGKRQFSVASGASTDDDLIMCLQR
jgi:ribosomal protein S18 acetylase RimI-like enzyme